jgi:hypothetical protein
MTDKETALATLAEFFTHIGGRQPHVDDAWDDYDHISADKIVGKRRYTISALVSVHSLKTVSVAVYDFRKKSRRKTMFRVNTTPALAAKFTLEAIDAYEAEMTAA